jgi:tetratricopeptide (TPR) repeat protein
MRPFAYLAVAVALFFTLPTLPMLAQDHRSGTTPEVGALPAAPAFDNLGDHHRTISTYLPQAQRYFDQGLRLMFAFNLEEAERSFRAAVAIDPTCASCSWGVALALGPHINFPATPERTVAAAAAAAEARQRAAGATPVERALIEALATRYSDPAPTTPEGQAALDNAYAEAMRGVAKAYPNDADVAYLSAEALLDLHPWDLYETDGTPKAWTPEIVSLLERALATTPDHAGLCHLYIHAVEASTRPERAVGAAERLRASVPGAGHLVHMPSHIFQRVGRYADSALANERAVAADGLYLPAAGNFMIYPMYAAHNHQFLWFAAQMEGRSAAAYAAARDTAARLPLEMLRAMPGYDGWLAYPVWTLVRFARWQGVLAEPLPPAEFAYASAVAHVARAIAQARLGNLAEAEKESAEAERNYALLPPESVQGFNPVSALAGIARNLAAAEVARSRGEWEATIAQLTAAVALEDALRYNEPSDWYFPVRHILGPVLLEAGRSRAAEELFRADLERNPENGWALTGLAAALRRQGKGNEAAAADRRLAFAWSRADLDLDRSAAPPERSDAATTLASSTR